MMRKAAQMSINAPEFHDPYLQTDLSFFLLFRFASKRDILLIIVGTLAALIFGTAGPFCALLTGSMIDAFSASSQIYDQAKNNLYFYLYLGGGAALMAMIMFSGWTIAGERQTISCRKQFFNSILKQQVAWYDTLTQGELLTNFSTDILAFQLAVAEKIPTLLMVISLLISGLVLAFIQGWLLALVIFGYTPAIIICWSCSMKVKQRKMQFQEKIYQQADAKAQQTLLAIKLVKQMNAQGFQSEKNKQLLQKVKIDSLEMSYCKNLVNFFALLSINLAFALSYWYGSQCVFSTQKCPSNFTAKPYTAGLVLQILYSLLLPAISLNQLTPCIQKIGEGKRAAARIFTIIDRVSMIQSKKNAIKPDKCLGVFRFQNVTFAYTKNKEENILQNMNAVIDGKSLAIFGDSGCGKSTIFQLMMRFYDPDNGTIYLDDIDLKQLDLQWLRSQIGYVRQEPVLFATSLHENMLLGKEEATKEEVRSALAKAEAIDFCNGFKEGLETFVGNGGNQLSGGQKQRIAIARALIKNPKILLLDEATSALDRRNEKQILKTLRLISKDFVTISITHRVNVLNDCQKIYQFKNKKIDNIKQNQFTCNKMLQVSQVIQQNATSKVQQDLFVAKQVRTQVKNQCQSSRNLCNIQNNFKKDIVNGNKEEKSSFNYLKSYASDYKCLIITGILLAVVDGLSFPAFGIALAQILGAQINYPQDPDYYIRKVRIYCWACLGLSFVSALANMTLHNCFGKVSAGAMKEIRTKIYEKLLKMPITWFQQQSNQPQRVINNLSTNCKTIGNFLQLYVPHLSIIIVNIVFSIIGSIFFDWRTGLTSIALLPLILFAQVIQFAFINGFNESNGKIFEESAQVLSESIMNIRTILSLGSTKNILNRYNKQLQKILDSIFMKCIFSSFMFGISYFIQYITTGLIFFFAAVYISNYGVQPSNVLSSIFLILFASVSAGNNSNYTSDLSRVKIAISQVFSLFKFRDQHEILLSEGCRFLTNQIEGKIQFKNVTFKYKNRENMVLNDVSFEISQGQKVGFVGSSGCGKSTILSLLLGFYTPTSGKILIDGIQLKDYDLHHLRSTFGVVSQEPVLFDQSISWNIRYNKIDFNDEEIVKAAHLANFYPNKEHFTKVCQLQSKSQAHKNIKNKTVFQKTHQKSNKVGFDKLVGPKGSHVSGGEKQRIAIARVILRSPKILLLDEATSALDPQNQHAIQSSLDFLMKNKTTLTVTHRMQTIQNSDQILVLKSGNIVQRGSYKALATKRGEFGKILQGNTDN